MLKKMMNARREKLQAHNELLYSITSACQDITEMAAEMKEKLQNGGGEAIVAAFKPEHK